LGRLNYHPNSNFHPAMSLGLEDYFSVKYMGSVNLLEGIIFLGSGTWLQEYPFNLAARNHDFELGCSQKSSC
jgi:hypothetical protein